MFDWLKDFVNQWANTVSQAIRDLVHWTVHALASVVYTLANNVAGAWDGLWLSIAWLWRQVQPFVAEVFGWIRQIVIVDIPALWSHVLSGFRAVASLIQSVWDRLIAAIEAAYRAALQAVDAGLRWVIDNVYAPLKALADAIYADLLKWGYFAWQLLNDPPKLAKILLGALISAAEDAFWDVADPIGRFLLGVLLHNATRFAQLLEKIVTAVL